jgi:hypothetical protein
MDYNKARIEALQQKITRLEGKVAYLEAYIEVNLSVNTKYDKYENE